MLNHLNVTAVEVTVSIWSIQGHLVEVSHSKPRAVKTTLRIQGMLCCLIEVFHHTITERRLQIDQNRD